MLKRVPNTYNSSFQYVGKDELTGYNEYIVPVREGRKKEITNLDDCLFDDDLISELPECNLDIEPSKERDFKNLTLKDFREMDFRELSFILYQQINYISSLISTNMEVDKDAAKL